MLIRRIATPGCRSLWGDAVPRSRASYANLILYILGVTGALITSFYMFRLIFLTFFGAPRYDEREVHVRGIMKSITIPLLILAFLGDLRRLVTPTVKFLNPC